MKTTVPRHIINGELYYWPGKGKLNPDWYNSY